MKDTLKKLYAQDFIESVDHYDFHDYYYFIDQNKVFGLKKDVVTDHELLLIKSRYELLREDHGNITLLNYLFGISNTPIESVQIKYYFIKFMNVDDEETLNTLDELLKDSFSFHAKILLRQNIYILVVDKPIDIEFKEILKTIESDFLIQLIGYESDLYNVYETIPQFFQFDFQIFLQYKETKNIIIFKQDLLKYHLISKISDNDKKNLKTYILKEFIHDKEMLNIVKMYFQTNFNLTLAAKKCYMHRNTFINKIDKFIQQTHFNIRQYEEALIVYFAMLM